ncbi:MAG: hypothetical protein Q7S74_04845 [Nanoarchaeota archaeon]|nr:hypothetical protein [Nanoarchaeota archaeon]
MVHFTSWSSMVYEFDRPYSKNQLEKACDLIYEGWWMYSCLNGICDEPLKPFYRIEVSAIGQERLARLTQPDCVRAEFYYSKPSWAT